MPQNKNDKFQQFTTTFTRFIPRLAQLPVICCLLLYLFLTASCHYTLPNLQEFKLSRSMRDSVTCLNQRHFTLGYNMELYADSVRLSNLPFKDRYVTLKKGEVVVVAEIAVHPTDSIDPLWIKLAASEKAQGWIRSNEMRQAFVPDDSISKAIHLFSQSHTSWFLIICTLFLGVWLFRMWKRKPLQFVGFNDIGTLYPQLLCLLVASSATLYESIQVFAPDTWEHFYFNPTFSPFEVPFILSLFISCLWLIVIVLIAAIDTIFRILPSSVAVFYTLNMLTICIGSYFFFILTTPLYIGYLFLALFIVWFGKMLMKYIRSVHYRCGQCNMILKEKGICPHCGAKNV